MGWDWRKLVGDPPERLVQLRTAVQARGGVRRILLALCLAAILALLNHFTQGAVVSAVFKIGGVLARFGQQSITAVGLAVVVWACFWFALILVLGWRDSRPKIEKGLQADLTTARAELDDARTKLDNATALLRCRDWWAEYRVETIPQITAKWSDADKADVAKEIARLDTVLSGLQEAIQYMIEEVTRPLSKGERWSFQASVRDCLRQEFIVPSVYLLKAVRFPQGENPLQLFKAFFDRYRELRHWILAVAEHHRIDVRSAAAYPGWRKADEQFFHELTRFPNQPAMAELRYEVTKYEEEGYPGLLPEPLIWDPEEVERILQGCTAPAQEFLGLLLTNSPSYDDDPDEGTKLPLAVFHAGRQLANQGVLSFRTPRAFGGEPFYFFTPTDEAEVLIRRVRFSGAPVVLRQTIAVRAKRIQFSEPT